jgi:hypothetical protein
MTTELVYTIKAVLELDTLAPKHPPCFVDQPQWVHWLAVAAVSSDRKMRPLKGSEFNRKVDFCHDCDHIRRHAMQDVGRCRPNWLVDKEDGGAR